MPDTKHGPARKEESGAAFMDKHTALPMVAMALFGPALVFLLVRYFADHCTPADVKLLCVMARANPPWILLSGLVAAPSVVLTWYWRTAHRKKDLEHKAAELDIRRAELKERDVDRQTLRKQGLATAFSEAVEALPKSNTTDSTIDVDAVITPAKELPDNRQQAVDELARYVRRISTGGFDVPAFRMPLLRAIRGISLLRAADTTLVAPSLERANLEGLDLRLLNLRDVELRNSNLSGTKLNGTLFLGASLAAASAAGAEYDESTELDPLQLTMLRMLGARTTLEHSEAERRANAEFFEVMGEPENNPDAMGPGNQTASTTPRRRGQTDEK